MSETPLSRAASIAACLAFVGMGVVEIWRGEPLPGLQPLPDGAPALAAPAWGALLTLAAVGMILRMAAAAWAMATLWFAALALTVLAAFAAPGVLALVPVAQTAAFAIFAATQARNAPALLRIAFGLMLVLFGVIHLTHRDIIASLIPDWILFPAYWPWVTGGVNVAAGLACLASRGVWLGAGAIALMYGAWLPTVHAPRLLGSPQSTFEWTFALTALALAAIALQIAANGYERNRANA